MDWERQELRPLFKKLLDEAKGWDPTTVMSRTQTLGKLVKKQLENFTDGTYRMDRNEARGFFEAIEKFAITGLPLSLDHFEDLIRQYQERISPYPHYSGIKIHVPIDFSNLDEVKMSEIPEFDENDDHDTDSTLKLV